MTSETMLPTNTGLHPSVDDLRQDFEHHLRLTLAKDPYTATDHGRPGFNGAAIS